MLDSLYSRAHHLTLLLSGLAKIWLANHIKSMVQLFHADAIQQLEVALLWSPVGEPLGVLTTGMMHLASPLQ